MAAKTLGVASTPPPRRVCALAARWTSTAREGPPPRWRVNSGATRWLGGSPPSWTWACWWVLTHGMGVYYLHAAALAFGVGLLTSYLLSIGWVFQARTWQNPWVELGFFTSLAGWGCWGVASVCGS